MSEEIPATNVADASETNSVQPNLITVHGKEFDVNDPIQKAQLSAWDEAHAKFVGRQSNELGKLRQFHKERQPTKDDALLVQQAKQKAAEGDLDAAIDMVFQQSKAEVAKANELRKAEVSNSELWEEYFAERPELAKKLGRQKIKQVSTALDIFTDGQDAFQALDNYWLPLLPSVTPVPAKPETPVKPPATLSGGTRKVTPSVPQTPAKEVSMDKILDERSVYFRK